MRRKKVRKRKSKSSKKISNGMIRNIIAIEEANKYEPAHIPEVKIEGYDPNFSASVNGINFNLRDEKEFSWGKERILLTRILYPMIIFSLFALSLSYIDL